MIVYAEDDFQNWSSDTVIFSVDRQASNIALVRNEDSWLSVYPNPTKNIFNIVFNEENEDIAGLTIQDIHGRVIWTSVQNQTYQMIRESKIDLSVQPPGIYLLKVSRTRGGFSIHKIIKN